MIFEGLFQLKLLYDSVKSMAGRSFVAKQNVSSPVEKDLGVLDGWKAGQEPTSVHLQPGRLITSWAAAKSLWPAEWGGNAPPLEIPARVLHPALASSAKKKTGTCRSSSRGGPWRSHGWNTSPTKSGWESLGKRRLLRRPYCDLQKGGVGILYVRCMSCQWQEAMILNWKWANTTTKWLYAVFPIPLFCFVYVD